MFKINFSGNNNLWGVTEIFEGHCPRMLHRGHGPDSKCCKLFEIVVDKMTYLKF